MFFAGCCLGSFYNVVIHRLPGGESIVSPGSHCPLCNHPIAWYDNIPLLSYLILRGKCRHCGARIPLRYPLVEGLTGVLTLLLFLHYGFTPQFFCELVLVSLLLLITFIDLDTYLIPDVLSITGTVVGFAFSFISPASLVVGLPRWESFLGAGSSSWWPLGTSICDIRTVSEAGISNSWR